MPPLPVAATPGIRLFPEPETVFAADVEKHAQYLSPLVSIDLSLINPEWSGLIHILSPIEPYEGCVGDNGNPEAYTYYLRPNIIGLQIDENNRYQLMGDFSFFENEHTPDNAKLREFYQKEQASYVKNKTAFLAGETLYNFSTPLFVEGGEPVFAQFGGFPDIGNWAGSSDFPLNEDPYAPSGSDDIYPVAENGNRFYFIASVNGYYFRDSGADEILLFYEPIAKIALLTFDWT